MNDIIVVFRSRSAALSFASALRSHGASGRVVNTPRALSASCGLSVRTGGFAKSVAIALCPRDATIYEIRRDGYSKINF